MISSQTVYLFTLVFLITSLYFLEKKSHAKIFSYVPIVVLIYLLSMAAAAFGMFEKNEAIASAAATAKSNLLPAMLFLILLQVDFRAFVKLGCSLVVAYFLAAFSLACAFIAVPLAFGLEREMLGAFGALCGSWMGGTANMIAVGSALGVSEEAFGYALLVDSINYTWWFALLLFLVPFASAFARFSGAQTQSTTLCEAGCSCTLGAKRYWLFVVLSLLVSFFVQFCSWHVAFLNPVTTSVVLATLLGIAGSFTKLRDWGGSNEIATSMLYLLVAIIGSQAVFEHFDALGLYVLVGFCILVFHALIMVVGAKIFKLDLFSIGVASLANIGGVASAPVLAAAYHPSLAGVGVLMAVMGYIIGTFGGLAVGTLLLGLGG